MEGISRDRIEELIFSFSACTLPIAQWSHKAHLIVALWYNMNCDEQEALELVRNKIKAYNLSVGTLNTEDSGYHETLTIFWMIVTRAYILNHPSKDIEEVCDDFLISKYATKTYPYEYYGKEVLFSVKARREWVNGDVKDVINHLSIF